ncbi:hypothetical protein, partial [Candidatus Hakubella thermalkaliphila]|uniref:hypothetical protein n=1 Tax=Candidatus Hakubella thermalkaliphila TaxID=2754717 RepID=UPI001C6132A9
ITQFSCDVVRRGAWAIPFPLAQRGGQLLQAFIDHPCSTFSRLKMCHGENPVVAIMPPAQVPSVI